MSASCFFSLVGFKKNPHSSDTADAPRLWVMYRSLNASASDQDVKATFSSSSPASFFLPSTTFTHALLLWTLVLSEWVLERVFVGLFTVTFHLFLCYIFFWHVMRCPTVKSFLWLHSEIWSCHTNVQTLEKEIKGTWNIKLQLKAWYCLHIKIWKN